MQTNPILIGTSLAVLAALAFGVTTPFIQRFGAGIGPFSTAALLYMGAWIGTFSGSLWRTERTEVPVGVRHLPRLFLVAFFGAMLAPTLFAWGLQRVPASYGSLLLNSEAIFTVGFAALIHREHICGRVALAAMLMAAGGVVSVAGASAMAPGGFLGALAIVAAVVSWSLDNVLTRPLADLNPSAVVRAKAAFGSVLTITLAIIGGEKIPDTAQIAGLLVCGAVGYGLSLRFYLLAQRRVGAARTGSVFAVAPFVGAAIAVLLGDKSVGRTTAVAAGFFALGVLLHLTERHAHLHVHETLEHDHSHTHEDGHHNHNHEALSGGPHTHPHEHEPCMHAHPHAPDVHHGHGHKKAHEP